MATIPSPSSDDTEEQEPLLGRQRPSDYGPLSPQRRSHHPKRQIGVVSAVFIIFNRIIGSGIFATPSTILGFSGSVGLSLVIWTVGAAIAAAGLQVYIIWGTALPRNGGEKNYLEYLFPRPKRLITTVYAANAVLLAHAAGNTLVFAEYALAAVHRRPSPSPDFFSPVRVVAFFCLTGVILLHGLHIPSGLRLQNILGFFKIGILCIVVIAGIIALSGNLQPGVERPGSFDSWEKIWAGSNTGGNVLSICLYNVIWSYDGFSSANYALAEMHNPQRTLRIAGPLAIVAVATFYTLCNVAYFAAASKEEITGSGRLVAALLFKNVWGERTERILNAFLALSAFGSLLSVFFSQARINQELGKEDVLPFSAVWASDWPANAPLAGLAIEWTLCTIVVFSIPQGDAYNFVLNVSLYPLTVVNGVISVGLIYLALRNHPRFRKHKPTPAGPTPSSPSQIDVSSTSCQPAPSASSSSHIHPVPASPGPIKAYSGAMDAHDILFSPTPSLLIPASLFAVASIFLVVVPLTKPPPGAEPYKRLPYWTSAVAGWGVFAIGALWWIYRERRRKIYHRSDIQTN